MANTTGPVLTSNKYTKTISFGGGNIQINVYFQIKQPDPNTTANCQVRAYGTFSSSSTLQWAYTLTFSAATNTLDYKNINKSIEINYQSSNSFDTGFITVNGLNCNTGSTTFWTYMTVQGEGVAVGGSTAGTVYWTAYKLTLVANPANAGYVTATPYPSDQLITPGTVVRLVAHSTKTDYPFDSYTSNQVTVSKQSNTGTFTMPSKAVTVTANFVQTVTKYTISIKSNNTSYGTVSASSLSLAVGESYTIKATPVSGIGKFSQWNIPSSIEITYGDIYSTQITIKLKSATNASITANFIAIQSLSKPTVNAVLSNPFAYGKTIYYNYSWTESTPSANRKDYYILVTHKGGKDSVDGKTAFTYTATSHNMTDDFNVSRIGEQWQVAVKGRSNNTSSYGDSAYGYTNFYLMGYYTRYNQSGALMATTTASSFNPNNTALYPSFNTETYQWDGWYSKKSGGSKYTTTITFSGTTPSVTVYARLKAKSTTTEYTITLNGNGGKFGTKTTDTATTSNSGKWTVNKSPTRDGYAFLGYATTSNATSASYKVGTQYTVNSNQTWYAVWGQDATITYSVPTITLINNSKLTPSYSGPTTATKEYGKTYTITSTKPTATGMTFRYWQDSGTGSTYAAGAAYTGNSPLTLTPSWTGTVYKVTYKQPTVGPTHGLSAASFTYNTTITLPAVTPSNVLSDEWRPQDPFWLVKNGSTTIGVAAGGTFPFVFNNTNTTITPQWIQVTSWRSGQLWIYVPEEA